MATLFKAHAKLCEVCGQPFRSARSDARCCSGRCRMRLQRRCDAITRGSAIAATAPGGAYVTGAGGVPVPVTLHPAVTKAVGPPAAVTKKPKPKAKPKKLGRAETVAILRNSTKRVKRWEKGDESIPTKGKKGRAK